MGLSRAEIVDTAISLLDRDGLDALSLRRLATELGIAAPTLYWHVRDKRQLLDLMAEEMLARHRANLPPIAPELDFFDRLAEQLRRQYGALIAWRDAARVVAGNRPTDSGKLRIEAMLGQWEDAGFAPDEALPLILSLGNYVLGAALEHQAEAERQAERQAAGRERPDPAAIPQPRLRQAATARQASGAYDTFEQGLKLMIDGLRVLHAGRVQSE